MIRKATILDSKAITDMWTDMVNQLNIPLRNADNKEGFMREIIVRIHNGNDAIFVAEAGTEFLGFTTAYREMLKYGSDKKIMHIDNMYIIPKHRGGEVYSLFYDKLNTYANENQCEEVIMESLYTDALMKIWAKKESFEPMQVTYGRPVCLDVN